MGARLVSKDWAKTRLAEGEIFWGNQQACKGERGQWKKVEKYQTCKAKAFWGNTALHSVGQIRLFLLSSPSCIFTSQTHWHQTSTAPAELHFCAHYGLAEGKHRAVVLSSPERKTRLHWLEAAVTRSVPAVPPRVPTALGICHLWGILQLGIDRDEVAFWNLDCLLMFMDDITLLERKYILKTTRSPLVSMLPTAGTLSKARLLHTCLCLREVSLNSSYCFLHKAFEPAE